MDPRTGPGSEQFVTPATWDQYEAWVVARRRRAARCDKVRTMLGVLAVVAATLLLLGSLFLFVEYGHAAPMSQDREPRPNPRAQQSTPVPLRGSLKNAEAYCEKTGGFWFVDDEPENVPGKKVVGCLWPVPKEMK